jgi:Acetyltransferases, including N-acetylases of ribosomal proteins
MSSGYIWESGRVRLRPVRPEDGPTHFLWNRDSTMLRAVDRLYLPQSEQAARRWAEEAAARAAAGEGEKDGFQFEIETLAGELVGSISTHHCDPRCGTFYYGVAVLPEHQRRGYATDAIRLVLRFYFGELRYQKVNAEVYAFNDASLCLHRRLGFREEGRLRRMVYTDGQFFDKVIFGLTAEEFAASEGFGDVVAPLPG